MTQWSKENPPPNAGKSKWDGLQKMEIGQVITLRGLTQRLISSGIHRACKKHKARYAILQLEDGVQITRLPLPPEKKAI